MSNDRLRDAMYAAGLTTQDVAASVDVDPKTVERWISQGRVPYPRHRHRLAAILGRSVAELWPDAEEEPGPARLGEPEIVNVYPRRASVPPSLWGDLVRRAARRIDVLAYSGLSLPLEQPQLLAALRRKAESGTTIRLLLGDPDSPAVAQRGAEEGVGGEAFAVRVRSSLATFEPLAGCRGVEVRVHRTTLYASIFQFDDEMLVNTHVYGLSAAHAPVLHLRCHPAGELFELYFRSFERVWQNATPAWTVDA